METNVQLMLLHWNDHRKYLTQCISVMKRKHPSDSLVLFSPHHCFTMTTDLSKLSNTFSWKFSKTFSINFCDSHETFGSIYDRQRQWQLWIRPFLSALLQTYKTIMRGVILKAKAWQKRRKKVVNSSEPRELRTDDNLYTAELLNWY